MQYLLDTHTFLWFLNGDDQLSNKARICIENPHNDCYISIASFWEIAIKISLKKLILEMSFKELYNESDKNGFSLLPITFNHTSKLASLKFYHRDPFDRIIICQALIDNLTIIGKDSSFEEYGIKQVW